MIASKPPAFRGSNEIILSICGWANDVTAVGRQNRLKIAAIWVEGGGKQLIQFVFFRNSDCQPERLARSSDRPLTREEREETIS